jgi:hypothetical protein
VATTSDPWTTTLVVPPINFTTTARATELQNGELGSCSAVYTAGGCFSTDLDIPSAPGAFASLTIYLRVDRTKINLLGTSIANAVIRYSKDGNSFVDLANCTATNVATPGNPCILARKAYDFTSPIDWQYDWEFKIQAVDNGRYVN